MTRFVFLRTVPRALCASAIALSLVVPLTGCGGGLGRPFGGGTSALASRKVGEIGITVQWPPRTRLIPDASNSIVVNIKDSLGRNAPGFPKTLVRPADISGSSPVTVANTTATNLEVGIPGSPENYSITASAYPTATGTGVVQSTGGTVVPLDTDNPVNSGVVFTLGTTIRTVEIGITDGSTSGQNLGKNRTRAFVATAKDATGAIVLTTASKWKWEILASGIGNFRNPDNSSAGATYFGNGSTYVAGDPGSTPTSVTIKVTETESSASDPVNPPQYTTTTTVNIVPLGLALSAWPRFHGTKQNLGVGATGTGLLGASATQAWKTALGNNVVFSSPTLGADGSIYICSYNEGTLAGGALTALNPNGTVRWVYNNNNTIGRIESSPVISQDGTIYFGSYGASGTGNVYAIKNNAANTGFVPVWVKQFNGPVYGTPALDSNGYLYIGTGGTDRKLYKLDSLNGNQSWSVTPSASTNTELQTSPALSTDEATLYAVSSGETLASGSLVGANLYAVNTTTGAVTWTFSTGDRSVTASSPVVSGGRVFFGTLDGFLYGVNAATGLLDWAQPFDAQAQIYSTVAVSPDGATLYFATFDNVSGLDESKIFAVNTVTGTQVWASSNFAQGFTSSPALSNDGTRLYIGCYDGNVYGVNTASGGVAWTFSSGAGGLGFDSSPAVAPNNMLYIGGFEGNLYALQP